MSFTHIDYTPRVWIGCLACYNAGNLVGSWHDAVDAAEVTTADVHGRPSSHEELWCFDIENLPLQREMSPSEAAEWGEALTSVSEHLQPALHAWISSGDYTAEGTGDLPSIDAFQELYAGHWDDFRDYAEQYAKDTGLLTGVAAEIARYFDWNSWARELAFDYTTCHAPEGGIYVFRSL